MKILIIGMDGYLGWPLAIYLTARGHEVRGADNFARRRWVSEMASTSAIPIVSMDERLVAFKEKFGTVLDFREGDACEYPFVADLIQDFQPDAVVHVGECPSAPYSMIDVEHATYVQTNNIISTLNLTHAIHDHAPDAHLLKLGTMGEYGTPNLEIPEGFFEIEYRGRKDRLPFPRQAGSWYHQSKVHSSNNIMLACKIWGIRSTDVMQGVVFGTRIDEMGDDERLLSRLDFDEAFGTAINRFCCQAVIGEPLTPFGAGHQKRGFLPLRDSMQCFGIALENPPEPGEYRVLNQFEEVYEVTELAEKVQKVGKRVGLDVTVRNVENPRVESEDHFYQPDHQKLLDLGYQPTHNMEAEMEIMLRDLMPYKDRIESHKEALIPKIRWSGEQAPVSYINEEQPVTHAEGSSG